MVTINGIQNDADGETLLEYLSRAGYDPEKVAVEQNETIVPKSQYAQTTFAEGDVIEVVSFVGGG